MPQIVREIIPKRFDLFSFLKEKAEKHQTFVLLDTGRVGPEDRHGLFFADPVKEIVWWPNQSPRTYFGRLEEALTQGYWLAGFFTYEAGYLLEKRLFPLFRPPEKTPLAWFGVFRAPEVLPAGPIKTYFPPRVRLSDLKLSLSFEEYASAIEKIKAYIASGDTYQVNFTLKYHFRCPMSAEDFYLALRPKQRVRYGALIRTRDFSVISLSPELFLRRQGRRFLTSPMKGTAERGRFLEEDQERMDFLANDPKNQAENVMIVDLLRNDLGRISLTGSVFVRELFKVERYETVLQMISTVEGELEEKDLFTIFAALFPCGSVTGAPKVRTMEIIAQLEREPRGVYTGALGLFSPSGDFVFNVPIRTLVLAGEQGEFGLGSGIVWDSDPRAEYEECLLKARFLLEPREPFSLVETMRFEPGRGVLSLTLHLWRLRRAATYFDFPYPEEDLHRLLEEVLNDLDKPSKLRLLLDEGGSLRLEVYPLPPTPKEVRIGLKKRPEIANQAFLFHKTTFRPWYEEARLLAEREGLFEIVFYNQDGELTEGTITNLFLEIDGKLYTPRLKAGLLPGILREELLRAGRVQEARLGVSDLWQAEKVYVGNALRGLLPVSEIKRL